jgi:outer membrane protein TolC
MGKWGAMQTLECLACRSTLVLFLGLFMAPAHAEGPISLEEAVRIALGAGDPTVARHEAQAAALGDTAVADGQLPDPRLMVGFVNWPTDSFDYDQEPMTQIQVGVLQRFPQGNILHFQQQRRERESSGAQAGALLQELQIVHDVRWIWLEIFYTWGALESVKESQEAVRDLITDIETFFATGLQSNQDLLRAGFELDLLNDRAIDITRQADLLRANLARFVGDATARRTPTTTLPDLGSIPTKDIIAKSLPDHPEILIEDKRISARDSEINIANERYRPSWGLEARYGARGGGRADFASLMVVVDLPLFTDKRQDKRLSAAKHEKQAALLDRSAKLLEKKRQLDRDYADWLRYGERIQLFEKVVINRASDTAEGALESYENQTADFAELIRARLAQLNTDLLLLRLRVNHAQSAAALLFLTGERP